MTDLIDDHGALVSAADVIIDELRDFDERMQRGEVSHQHHSDFARRARFLTLHLTAVRALVADALYPSAFSLLRTTLEHHLMDHLMFLGRRYVQIYDDLPDEQWDELIADYEAGAPNARTIVERPTRSRRGRVTVVREGLYANGENLDDSDYAISPDYFAQQQYDPLTGRPSDQEFLDDGLVDVQLRVDQARRQRDLWYQYLTWSSITESLERNNFYSRRQVRQLQVHYRFLSAFVHATDAAYELAYQRGIRHGDPPIYDHYSSELALLYMNVIAAKELDALLEMTTRTPPVEVPTRDQLQEVSHRSHDISKHLWFPGGQPHEYDRVREANRRVWQHYRESRSLPEAREANVRPSALDPDAVGYYDNPLQRIVSLHQSMTEMTTGFTYRSPWERHDAQFRA